MTNKKTYPATQAELDSNIKDWSESLVTIMNATNSLAYALPDSNTQKIESAMRSLKQATADLDTYLKARGFEV